MIKYKLFIIVGLLFSSLLVGQKKNNAKEILEKAIEVYDSQPYLSYNSKYILYQDYTSKKILEQYNGVVVKKNSINYFKINNTEYVSFGQYALKISNDEKIVVLEKENEDSQQPPLSFSSYLKGFESRVIADKDFFICELKPSKISQIMFQKVLLYIKKSDYSIVKQEMYFVEKMEVKDGNGKLISTLPRLEITFMPRPKNPKNDDFLVKKENYFTEKNSQIVISKRLSAYGLYCKFQ